MTRLLLCVATFVLLNPTFGSAQTFDLTSDFSLSSNQTSDTWSFYESGSLLNTSGTVPVESFASPGGFPGWYTAGYFGQSPAIGVSQGSIVARPGWINCLGGCAETLDIRFRAPASGTADISLVITEINPGEDAGCFDFTPRDMSWRVDAPNGGILASGILFAGESSGPVTVTGVPIAQGQTILFQIGTGQGCQWYDFAALDLSVTLHATVPVEESTWGAIKALYSD